jgi:hypothetical protein
MAALTIASAASMEPTSPLVSIKPNAIKPFSTILNLLFFEFEAPRPRAGLPGKEISIYIVPLDPAYPAIGGTGHLPVKGQRPVGFPYID